MMYFNQSYMKIKNLRKYKNNQYYEKSRYEIIQKLLK